MISTLTHFVNSQCAVDPMFFGGPWIPLRWSKCPTGHPRGSFPRRWSLLPVQARFPRYFGPPDRRKNLPGSTVLTETPQLDSSYEATTPSRLDLVLRQRGLNFVYPVPLRPA